MQPGGGFTGDTMNVGALARSGAKRPCGRCRATAHVDAHVRANAEKSKPWRLTDSERAGDCSTCGDEDQRRGGRRSSKEVIVPCAYTEASTELPPLAEAQCVDNDLHLFAADSTPATGESAAGEPVVVVAAPAAAGGGGSAPAAAVPVAAQGGTGSGLGDVELGPQEASETDIVAQQVPSTRWREPVVAVELRSHRHLESL